MPIKSILKKLSIGLIAIISLPIAIIFLAAPFNWATPADQDYAASKLLQNPPSSLTKPIELKVMTYNIAIAHGFTTNQRERISAIADLLIELDVDVVGLQEVFIQKDREFLYSYLAETPLKYHSEYPSGLLGNGLVILSKYPITESYFHRFKANNSWWKVWEGDWWAGKGIGMARIEIEDSYIDFYNVHAQAYRGNQASDDVRLAQFKEASIFLNNSSLKTVPAFFVGDYNTQQGRPDYVHLETQSNLHRLMRVESKIDHIAAVNNPLFTFEVLVTKEIKGTTMGSHPGKFYSRAPSALEFWEMHYGAPGETALSDHPGYISTVSVFPNTTIE